VGQPINSADLMHAVIITEGQGTRAAAMTGDRIPKALLPVAGVPIIIRQMRVLRREGVTRLSVLAGHLGDHLRPALAPEAAALGLELEIIVESKPLGTAGGLTTLDPGAPETLIVYGDLLFDIALAPLREFHLRKNALITVVAHPNDHPRSSDLIVARDGLVQVILPRGRPRSHDHRNLVPAGLYLAAPAFFAALETGTKADMINDVLPRLIAAGLPIAAYDTPEYLCDIGSPPRLALAERDLQAGRVEGFNSVHPRPAIFFDCDGVLNEEPGDPGIVAANQVKTIPGAGAALRRAWLAGLLAVAVTNRPQVAKGLVTLDDLDHILGCLEALLAEDGGVLDRIYFCPHYPQAGCAGEIAALKIRCECRKPGSLLLRQALADLPIDRLRSMLIGDSLRDIGAARGVGIWAYGVRTGYGCRDRERYRREAGVPPVPDLMFETVSEAVDFGLGYRTLAAPVMAAIRRALVRGTTPVLVGVSGRSRAGKSAIAHAAIRSLSEDGVAGLHVRLDDWIMAAPERAPCASAETRNRVDALPGVVAALRAGATVSAPGYDAATRGAGETVTYGARGRSVILLDGSFAAHASLRPLLDVAVFVAPPPAVQQERFAAFYRWKGLDQQAIDALWRERAVDEWPAVDMQQAGADLVLAPAATAS
jgi:mannose-1-phosphate guanylyltransferase / phosphomannomutase